MSSVQYLKYRCGKKSIEITKLLLIQKGRKILDKFLRGIKEDIGETKNPFSIAGRSLKRLKSIFKNAKDFRDEKKIIKTLFTYISDEVRKDPKKFFEFLPDESVNYFVKKMDDKVQGMKDKVKEKIEGFE